MILKPGIEVAQLIVGEPQEEQSYFNLQNQSIPFDKVTKIKNVFPMPKALNLGIRKAEHEYIGLIAADIVLDLDANEKIQTCISLSKKIIKENKLYSIRFAIYDPFIDKILRRAQRVYYTKNATRVLFENDLKNDVVAARLSREMGFKEYFPREPVVIGTHFDKPRNKEYVFRRFYVWGIKSSQVSKFKIRSWTFPCPKLEELHKKTKDPLYKVAIKAFDLGFRDKDRYYGTVHNIVKDKEVFEKYKNQI